MLNQHSWLPAQPGTLLFSPSESERMPSACCYLFAPIPVGSDCTNARRAQRKKREQS